MSEAGEAFPAESNRRHTRIAIVGSGFGGLGMAMRLQQEGLTDFVVFERAAEIGGVWRDNRYPGAACDVESHLYSFSFAPNPRWTRRYSPQAEIREYLQRCATDFGIHSHIRLEHDVERVSWDDARLRWRIETSHGAYTAEILVAAPGALSEPRLPDLPRLGRYAGRMFHTARWPADLSLAGRRVAVVGTGASAIQVVPAIQPEVERLFVFQRTAPWVIPRGDRALNVRLGRWLNRLPLLRQVVRGGIYGKREMMGVAFRHPRLTSIAARMARQHLQRQVPDAALRQLLTPDYTIGCKRVLVSDDYYPALVQPNVEVVTGGAMALTPRGVVAADGVERAVDVVVFGTGFEATEFRFAERVLGRDGRRLADAWGPSPAAHLGTKVTGFPNLFILMGPNTGLGHSSVVLMIEAQIRHVLNAVGYMDAHRVAAVEPRPEAQAAFVEATDRMMTGTVWTAGGCRSWYLDETGRNSTLWPGSVRRFRRQVEPFRPQDHRLHRRAATPVPAAGPS